jgi:hypothetical protein
MIYSNCGIVLTDVSLSVDIAPNMHHVGEEGGWLSFIL